MKTNPTTSDIHVAMARVEKARGNKANAAKRHSRAQTALETASRDVADAEKEFTAASTQLDQAVKKALNAAMKKGGTDMSIALAEIIARSMTSEEDEVQLPLEGGESSSRSAQAPSPAPATPAAPSIPAPTTATEDEQDDEGQDDADDVSESAGTPDATPSRAVDASAEA